SYEHGFAKKHYGHKLLRIVEFQSVFRLSSLKFKIQAIPNVFALRKSYELSFVKKCNGYKLYTKLCFNRFFVYRLSRKFTILAIPNVLAQGKSYKHSFTKKCYGHKLCAKLSFNRFFIYHLENSKFRSFPMYLHIRSRMCLVS
ncbi:hypothetical protein BHM03_00058914, partial [Ensete ventricosum]